MMTTKAMTLKRGLDENGIGELPKQWTPDSGIVWIIALALVTKSGVATQEYVLVRNQGDGRPVVMKDYGTSAIILSYDKIFPILKLDKKYLPDLRSLRQQREYLIRNNYPESEIDGLLSKEGKSNEQINVDRLKIRDYINHTALRLAQDRIREENRCRNIYKPRKDKDNGKKKTD